MLNYVKRNEWDNTTLVYTICYIKSHIVDSDMEGLTHFQSRESSFHRHWNLFDMGGELSPKGVLEMPGIEPGTFNKPQGIVLILWECTLELLQRNHRWGNLQ